MNSLALLVLLAAGQAHAGFFDDVSGMASDVGDFFTKKFNSAKDLFAGNQGELEKNINRVKDLLTGLKEKTKMLEPMATDAQKATLAKVDEYLGQVNGFQKEAVAGGAAKFDENKAKWQQMVEGMFEKGGLSDLMRLLNVKAGSQASFCVAAAVPLLMALYR